MNKGILSAGLLAVTLPAAAEMPRPRFEDFKVMNAALQTHASVQLVDHESKHYRTQLRKASKQDADFAGHFVLARWGCGSSCMMAAAIDIDTGAVTWLPFTVSWPLDVSEPLEFKRSSRLLIIRGSRNEKGVGTYYYVLTDSHFELVKAVENSLAGRKPAWPASWFYLTGAPTRRPIQPMTG